MNFEFLGFIIGLVMLLLVAFSLIAWGYMLLLEPIWDILKRFKHCGIRNCIICFIKGHDYEHGTFKIDTNLYSGGTRCKRCGMIFSDGYITYWSGGK